jgi:hypothetical protein
MDYRRLLEDLALGKLVGDVSTIKENLGNAGINAIKQVIKEAEAKQNAKEIADALNNNLQIQIQSVVRIAQDIQVQIPKVQQITSGGITVTENPDFLKIIDETILLYFSFFQEIAGISKIIDKMMVYHGSGGFLILTNRTGDLMQASQMHSLLQERFNPGRHLDSYEKMATESKKIQATLSALLDMKSVIDKNNQKEISKIKDYINMFLIEQNSTFIKLYDRHSVIYMTDRPKKEIVQEEESFKTIFTKIVSCGNEIKSLYEKIVNKDQFIIEDDFEEKSLEFFDQSLVISKNFSYESKQNLLKLKVHTYDYVMTSSYWIIFDKLEESITYKNLAETWFNNYRTYIGDMKYFPNYIGWGLFKKDDTYQDYTKRRKKNSKEGCFIATATYGSTMALEVNTFRIWRDTVLTKSTIGNLIINLYYKISPPIAKWISKDEKRKEKARIVLDFILKQIRKY